MKKLLLIAISLVLALTMLLSACNPAGVEGDPTETSTNTETDGATDTDKSTDTETDAATEPDDETDAVEDTKYRVIENYMPENVSSTLKELFENKEAKFITYTYGSCPYVIRDVFTISDCRLVSISIPVAETLRSDENGDYFFTITVGFNEWYSIKNTPRAVYEIAVNAEEYDLYDNSEAYKWIKVDLTEYNIVLRSTETIGFGNENDTLIPAYIGNGDSSNKAQVLIRDEFPQIRGFVSKMGLGGEIGTSASTLIYDFEFERTYESREEYEAVLAAEAEYAELLAAVKAAYSGKKLSILGDSISTYPGYSNNSSHNSTIGGNAIYYNTSGAENVRGLYDQRDTYWYRLLTDLNMELCVNNSWSGSRVYDSSNMLNRAGQLHRDNGTPSNPNDDTNPDVILFYMGINDLHNDKSGEIGDLYQILQSKTDTRPDNEKIEEWLDTINKNSPSTFEQYYALAIMTMQAKYTNAEIWCLTLNHNKDSRFDTTSLKQYNRCITAIATYFGCNVVDQTQGYIVPSNCVKYSCDGKGLHPNPAGHALMEKYIVECFYAKLEEK